MQATNRPTPGHPAFPALADAALPARVRAILLQVRELAATQLGPWLEATLDGLENQLFNSDCDTDMNVVMNDGGGFIELQGTAEGHAFRRDELDALLGLAERGIGQLLELQRQALAG